MIHPPRQPAAPTGLTVIVHSIAPRQMAKSREADHMLGPRRDIGISTGSGPILSARGPSCVQRSGRRREVHQHLTGAQRLIAQTSATRERLGSR